MTLYDELYFEITATGPKSEIKRLVSFLKSGEINDFFEFSSDYIIYDDDYATASADEEATVVISNDDFGIEIDEFHTDEFLEVFCKAAKNLDVYGSLFDNDDSEFHFTSAKGDSYYVNSRKSLRFNDELDEVARGEEEDEDY